MWLTRLYRRFRHLVHELGKFGIVGTAAYLVDSVILIALTGSGWEPLGAKTVATTVATTLGFVGNRHWTWRHRPRTGVARQWVLYFLFNAVGLGISLACVGISYHWLGAASPVFRSALAVWVSANVVGLAAGTVFRFWTYRRFVFPVSPSRGYPGDLASATSGRHVE